MPNGIRPALFGAAGESFRQHRNFVNRHRGVPDARAGGDLLAIRSERAQARSVALHGRAAKRVELCATALMEQRMKTAAEAVKKLSDPDRLRLALERVTEQLTTEEASPDVA